MPLTVDPGAPDADSYVSTADAFAYAVARGLAFPTSPSAPAEAALRTATAWIDAKYRSRFPGSRLNGRAQALEWPRANATDVSGEVIASDEIPVEILNATIEAAIRELAEPGTLSPDLERGGAIKRVKAGSVEVEYGGNATAATVFSAIDAALSGLLKAASLYTARAARG